MPARAQTTARRSNAKKTAREARSEVPDPTDPKLTEPPAIAPSTASDPAKRTMTRGEVARELGISITTIRRAETTGDLKFDVDVGNVRKFSLSEVRAYGSMMASTTTTKSQARLDAGELSARAFEHFNEGGTAQSAVTALRIPYVDAARMHGEWSAAAPVSFSPGQLAELESLGVPARSGAEVIAAVRRLRDRLREARATPDRPTPRGR